MNPATKVVLGGRPLKKRAIRYKNGKKEVLHLIFSINHPGGHSLRPVFVAESPDPIKWARYTRGQWRSREVGSWLRWLPRTGVKPIIKVLEEVWVPEGTRRSSRLAWWVRELRPSLQGTLGSGDPMIGPSLLREGP